MKNLTICTLLILIWSAPLVAADSLGLYQNEVVVTDQGEQARADGMQQAMGEVLLKVTGTAQVFEDEWLLTAMSTAGQFVQQYRYRSEAIPQEEQQPDENGQVLRERLYLSVRFDANSIDDLLRQHGYTIWGETRPVTLVWLGVEQEGNRVLVGANDTGLVRELIDKEAARRALPVKLPLLDLTDQSALSMADIWGDFLDSIQSASLRYHPQAILVGRLYPVIGGQWGVRWTLLYQGETFRWLQQSSEVAPLIAEGIGNTAEHLVQRFAESFVTGSDEILLEISGVQGLSAYGRVMDYLAGLPGVKEVKVNKMMPTALSIRIRTGGGSDAVLQTIALGDVLEVAPAPLGTEPPAQPVEKGDGGDSGDGSTEAPKMSQKVFYYHMVP
jgi:uncharacterized protein